MLKRLAVMSAAAALLGGTVLPLGAATVVQHRIRHLRPHFGFRHRFPVPQPATFDFPRPDELAPPDLGEPPVSGSPPIEEEVPLPHGFALTVPVGSGSGTAAPSLIGRYAEAGKALGACWHPPAGRAWSSVTLRVSFKRDGTIYGMPRIPFTDARSPDDKSQVAQSLMAALKQCTPLPLSASLGSAIAGEIFAIRFINQDSK